MSKKLNIKQISANFLLVCGMVSALCATFVQVKGTFFPEKEAAVEEVYEESAEEVYEEPTEEMPELPPYVPEPEPVSVPLAPEIRHVGKPTRSTSRELLYSNAPKPEPKEEPNFVMQQQESIVKAQQQVEQLKKDLDVQNELHKQQIKTKSLQAPEPTDYTWIIILVSLAAVGGGIILRKKIVKEVKEI